MSKILIVEDEESIADLEKDYLELSGFEVEVANDGQTGLDKALFGDFDLVILDLGLPDRDGLEFIRTVRLKRAAQYLAQSDTRISEIMYSVGFNSHSYFTKCFREHFGLSPKEYAEKHRRK